MPFAVYAASAAKGAKYAKKGVDAAQSASKGADSAGGGAKAASNAAQGGGKASPAPAKASSGGGGATGGKSSGGGGSAGPAKAGGGGGAKSGGGGGTAASKGGSCRTNSFVPGTAVLMADGSYRAIEDVESCEVSPLIRVGVTDARPVWIDRRDGQRTGGGHRRHDGDAVLIRCVSRPWSPFWSMTLAVSLLPRPRLGPGRTARELASSSRPISGATPRPNLP